MILYEYDEQRQLAIAREGAMKAGREEGRMATYSRERRGPCSGTSNDYP